MNEITRFLIDKEKVIIDNKLFFRLWFFDATEGNVVKVLAPVLDKEILVRTPKEDVQDEPIKLDEDEYTPEVVENDAIQSE